MKNIQNLSHLGTELLGDSAATLQRIRHRIYRDTPNGLGLDLIPGGITFSGIVEGTEIEATSDPLIFPFTTEDFYTAQDNLAAHLDEMEWEQTDLPYEPDPARPD